jgi:hypothetical protein
MVPELYGPIYKGVFSDICPLLSTPDFLVMIAPAKIAWPLQPIAYRQSSSAKRLPRRLNRFTRQTLPTTNRKYFFMNILCPQQNAIFGSTHSNTVAILSIETSL